MRNILNLAITLLLCFLPTLANANENGAEQSIRFLSEISAPYYFFGDNGKAQGINVDTAQALTTELHIDAQVEQIPWARAIKETRNKPNRILLSILRTKSREDQFQWLGHIHQVRASLVSAIASTDIEIQTLEEAKQYRIGTIRGYGSAQFLLKQGFVENVNLVLVSDIARLWQMLNEGRIDMVISNLTTDKYEILDIGLNPADFTAKLALPQLDLDLYVATGLKTDKNTVTKISNALQKIKQQGKLQTILNKWGVE